MGERYDRPTRAQALLIRKLDNFEYRERLGAGAQRFAIPVTPAAVLPKTPLGGLVVDPPGSPVVSASLPLAGRLLLTRFRRGGCLVVNLRAALITGPSICLNSGCVVD